MVSHARLLTVGAFLDGSRPAHDRVCAAPWHAALLTWASAHTIVVAERITIRKRVTPTYIRLLPNRAAYLKRRLFRLIDEHNCHNSQNVDILNDRRAVIGWAGKSLMWSESNARICTIRATARHNISDSPRKGSLARPKAVARKSSRPACAGS